MGIGDRQIKDSQQNRRLILSVLSDGKWHRHGEILEKTKLSPTTLSKHLKILEKGLIEKRIDLESGEYPYPVYYRLKEKAAIPEHLRKRMVQIREVKKILDAQRKEYVRKLVEQRQIEKYLEELHQLQNFLILSAIEGALESNLESSRVFFKQCMEDMIFPYYYESVEVLAEALIEAKEKGLDALKIIEEAKNPYEESLESWRV